MRGGSGLGKGEEEGGEEDNAGRKLLFPALMKV